MNKELLQARIDWRLAELRLLAAKTVYEIPCQPIERSAIVLMLKQAAAKRRSTRGPQN
jgi:hypothetical protein